MRFAKPMFFLPLVVAAIACSSDGTANSFDFVGLAANSPERTAAQYVTPASVTIQPDTVNIGIGQSAKLTVNYLDANGGRLPRGRVAPTTFSSSDSTVAVVDQTGTVTGLAGGSAKITANTDGKVAIALAIVAGPGVTQVSTAPTTTTTTTTTTTATTATATTTGALPDVSGKGLVADNFSGYADTRALQANISTQIGGTGNYLTALYSDGYNGQLASLDQSVLYNGHATLRYDQPANTGTTPALWVYFPNGKRLTRLWFRAVIRFSPGFSTYGTATNAANAYKLLGWGWADNNGRGGLGFTNTNDYTFTWCSIVNGTVTGDVEPTGFKKMTTEWSDGGWYDYIILYEQTSATTTRTRWWFARAGQTPVLQYTMDGTMTTGTVPQANRVMLGLNFNNIRPAAQSLWYGMWEAIDGSAVADPYGLLGQ